MMAAVKQDASQGKEGQTSSPSSSHMTLTATHLHIPHLRNSNSPATEALHPGPLIRTPPSLPHDAADAAHLSTSFSLGVGVPFGGFGVPAIESMEGAAEERRLRDSFVSTSGWGGAKEVAIAVEKESAGPAAEASLPPCVRDGITDGQMLREMLKVGLPCCASLGFTFVAQAVTMAFVGHRLGSVSLAQFAVGLSIWNVAGASLGIGFAGAMDTLGPQAYGSDMNTPEIALLFQRSCFFHLIFFAPVVGSFFFVEPLLVSIFGEVLGTGAAAFLRQSPLLLFATWLSASYNRLFPAHHLSHLPLIANLVGTLLAVPVNMYTLGTGTEGTATLYDAVISLTFIQCVILATHIAFAVFHPKSLLKTAFVPKPGFLDRTALTVFFRLGIASMVGTCSEWWSFEMLQVLCARIGERETAAFTIMLNILLLYFSLMSGLSAGGGTMVGNALGAGKGHLGKKYLAITLKVGACVIACTVTSILLFGRYIFEIYTQDPDLEALLQSVLYLLAYWHIADSCGSITFGLFRGAGKQEKAAATALGALWLVGIPLAVVFGLWLKFGLVGIIIGQAMGLTLLIPLRFYDIRKWDWDKLSAEATSHLQVDAPSALSKQDQDPSSSPVVVDGVARAESPRHVALLEVLPSSQHP